MPIDLIHCKPKNKTQASQLALTNTSPSPMAREEAYYEAQNKIEEARRSGAKELPLIHMGLTELSMSVARLAKLQKLYLSENHLKILPKEISKLTNLKELDLSKNQLTTLPESLGNLVNLESLEREKQIKGWLRKKKIDLINSLNPEWKDLYEEWFV